MNTILERLIEMNAKKRLHHGFLFSGAGKKTTSDMEKTTFDFAVHLLSEGESPEIKQIVTKKISNQNHPDFLRLVSPEGEIKIESIRELQKWLHLPPLEASKKIAVIEEAQHLNVTCANALLKTLEEPPLYALIILQTNSVSRLLPTIRSRLFGIQFPEDQALEQEDEREWLMELKNILQKKTFTDKEIFSFTEQLTDKRDDLIYFFNFVQKTIRDRMKDADAIQFNQLEKVFDLAVSLEQELYQNYGNISLGLDSFLMEMRTA